MPRKLARSLALVATAACAAACASEPVQPAAAASGTGPAAAVAPLRSQVIARDAATATSQPVADLRAWLEHATTRSLRDVLFATVTLKAGQQLHPPHSHAEEELLYIVSGEGTWSLAGNDFAAHPEDVLYSEPWVEHGLRAGDAGPLTFLVVKWNPRNEPDPQKPAAAK